MVELKHRPQTNRGYAIGLAWMRDLSLRYKLMAIVMLTSVSALLLAGVVFTVWEWSNLRQNLVNDLSSHADILGDNCELPILFDDAVDSQAVLETVEPVSSIAAARLYKKDGTLYASYERAGAEYPPLTFEKLPNGHRFEHNFLILVSPFFGENGEQVGTICLVASLDQMYSRLAHGIAVIGCILLVATLAAFLFSSKLQSVISSPILYLADVANFISREKQYAMRAEHHSGDEVGLLVEAFNEMLEQIQQRDSALVAANEKLEAGVRERTSELTHTNERLTREIAFRKKAEQILKQRTERIIHHQRTLVKLSKYTNKDLAATIHRTTEEAAKTLSVERVSVWFLNKQTNELICEDMYERSVNTHNCGLRLQAADFPDYFQAIESSRIVAADNARIDPRTHELTENYLNPAHITSVLDVPIRLHGETLGILSHAQVDRPREWSLEEQDFAASIADMISLQIEATERQKAERALAKANKHLAEIIAELRRSNKELQDFAYVTAHDLKAPLRGIGTLTDWITSDYADKLDEQGREQLALLKGRVSRMSELIDSILHYSEIGRTSKTIEPVDLNTLVQDVVGQLCPPEHILITVDPNLPTLTSEKVRLMQLFQNLIGNAIKYMDKPQGHIEVTCSSQGDEWQFGVSDNGPGINEKYFTKIFQMFQTLTRRDELESTGIGLAVVKKLVDLYGGQVWVESTVGKGTTFYFTLPKHGVVAEKAEDTFDEIEPNVDAGAEGSALLIGADRSTSVARTDVDVNDDEVNTDGRKL